LRDFPRGLVAQEVGSYADVVEDCRVELVDVEARRVSHNSRQSYVYRGSKACSRNRRIRKTSLDRKVEAEDRDK
jgi:hypothetical protein